MLIGWSQHSKQTSFDKKNPIYISSFIEKAGIRDYMYQSRRLLSLQMLLFELWASLSTTKTSPGLNYSTNVNDLSTYSTA